MGYEGAKCLSNEAIALGQQGKAVKALDLFGQARAAFLREKNYIWPWLIDLYRALVLFNEGRLFEARRSCEKALNFFGPSTLQGKAGLCHLLLARIELRCRNTEGARKHCHDAIQRLATLEIPVLDYQANFLMAEAHAAAGDLESAYSAYQNACEALETLRSSLRKDELKIAFMKNKSEVYERLVEICLTSRIEGSGIHEAFKYIELAKSRSLAELIFHGTHGAQESAAGHSQLVRRIRDLREELNWYYHRIDTEQLRTEENNLARIEHLQTEAQEREKALLRTLRELPDAVPETALLRGSQGVPLEEIQALLPRDSTLIEYFAVGDQLLAVVLKYDGIEIMPVTLLRRTTSLLQMLRSQLSKLHLDPSHVRRFERALFEATQSHLQELYAELIEPIQTRISGKHIIFVPHGILHSLPFHALFDGRQYLIDMASVSYAPSASIYALCQARQATTGDSSLVLGVPDAQAPSISEEVSAVAAAIQPARVFVGEAATEQTLREWGPKSRWIHLATHGIFRGDNPMFSGIRLSHSYLNLLDFYSLRLPAELVTLSGCATGLNVVAGGDEILGLSRGLLGAGARCLMLTLWDVHDLSTAEFMSCFYRKLQNSESKAQALREAMRSLREKYPHPYYWAPFFLTGNAVSC